MYVYSIIYGLKNNFKQPRLSAFIKLQNLIHI